MPVFSLAALGQATTQACIGRGGTTLTIEPFISTRSRQVHEAADGWTLVGGKGNLSAQYEHTMIITKDQPIVVTRH